MTQLGNGLYDEGHYEDSLSVKEADLALRRRLGDTANNILGVQGNLAGTYQMLGRLEDAMRIHRDVYSGYVKLKGEEHGNTCLAAYNYASALSALKRFDEIKALLPRTILAARRTLGESHAFTLSLRGIYGEALYGDPAATLEDLREAVETLEETERIAQRVFGGANPTVGAIVDALRVARAALNARRETSRESNS